MKRSLIVLGLFLVLALAGITLMKEGSVDVTDPSGGASAAEVEKVESFWRAYNKGNALRASGEFAAAVPAFREALAINPHHEDSLYYLGTSLFELGEYSEAAETLRKIVAANPSSGRAWSQLGNTLSTQAPGAIVDFDGAQHAYERSSELNREQAGPFLRMGALDLNRGRWAAARENFKLAAGFGSPDGSYLVAYSMFLAGRDRDALPFLRKVLDAYAKEKKSSGRGTSEGDVKATASKPLSALDKAALKSIYLVNSQRMRRLGEAKTLADQYSVPGDAVASSLFIPQTSRAGIKPGGGRGAWADFDRDGKPDLIVTGLGRPVALYESRGGKFEDVTAAAGLGNARNAWDAVWADYDGDGFPDLYLIRAGYMGKGQNTLYHNNRNGTFTDVTSRAGLQSERSTSRACFAELSGSGHPDLVEIGAADATHFSVRLYRNTGAGFVDMTRQSGLDSRVTATDCATTDYDHDGKPDLIVLFWKQGVGLFHNQGGGRFLNSSARAGLSGVRVSSFSLLFFDYDKDGWPDLLISSQASYDQSVRSELQPDFHIAVNTPRLFHNQHNGTFAEVTQQMGLNRCYGTMQALAADFDADGWSDLMLVNGSLDALRMEPTVVLRNVEGRKFEKLDYVESIEAPANFVGGAIADFNADGRPDVYLARNPHLPERVSSSGIFLSRVSAGR